MSETLPALRVLLLAADAAPPLEAAPEGAAEEDACWSRLELDAFLAALDAGEALPDLVLVPGADPEVLAALRGHPAACCLPVYAVGATPPGAGGWDGVVSAWTPALAEEARDFAAAAQAGPSREPLESARRAHGFARFLASRGAATLDDARAFGIRAPRSLAACWQERGWVAADAEAPDLLRALPALGEAARWSRLSDPASAQRPDPEPTEPQPVEPPSRPDQQPEPQPSGPPSEPQPVTPPEEPQPVRPPEEPQPVSPPESPGPWPGDDPPAPVEPPRGRRRGLLAAASLLVLALVSTRGAAEAGLVPRGGLLSWVAGETPVRAWEAPRPQGPRLVVPADDPRVASRLAAGDPAFRPPLAAQEPTDAQRADRNPGDAVPAPGPVVEEVVDAPGVSTPDEPLPPAPPFADPPPTYLAVTAERQPAVTSLLFPLDGGAVAEWRAAPGDAVAAGQLLALLEDPRVAAREAELQSVREGFSAERSARLAERQATWQTEDARLQGLMTAAEAAVQDAAARVAQLDAVHARNLELVEAGVLGYSEIRADWDALLAARAEERRAQGEREDVRASRDAHTAAAPTAEGPGAAEALLLARLQQAVEEARASAVLRAPSDGVLRGPLAASGVPQGGGQAVASLELAEATGSVRLDAARSSWLDARLVLLPAEGVRVPVAVQRIERDPDGAWSLSFPWPESVPAPATARLERDG